MSNFMSDSDALQVLGTYANSIKAATPTEITYAQYQQLTPEQIANGNYMVSDWAGSLTSVAHVYHGKVVGGSGGGDVSGKADKVSGATSGNFAGLDANGNLTDSGHKHSDYLTSHQDISGKADKPSTATTGNFASFDANKNPVDSGKKASDFMPDGTVGVSKGGTGATSLTSGAALIGNGTSAVQTRAITDITSTSSAISGSTNLSTMNSVVNCTARFINRGDKVNDANTSYGSVMARGIYATTTDLTAGTTALTSGVIALVYE